MIPWLAALFCLTLAHAGRAADDSEAPKVSNSQVTGAQPKLAEQDIWKRWKLAHDPQEASAEVRLSAGAPTQANKASGLLGMEVRNQNGERLGHIKDLVIDWKTEQVSYAVISASSKAMPGIGEKLLAVPLAALAISPDQKHLVLDADKSKVQAARGFDRDDWPSVSNPSWGAEPFWQHDADRRAAPDQPAQ
jgi:sporulation protein YlmC with PRC-barrel domain